MPRPLTRTRNVFEFIAPSRLAPWHVLFVYLGVILVWPVMIFGLGIHAWLQPIARTTGWLINGTMLAYVASFLVLWLVLGRWGGLGTADLGLDRSKLMSGVAMTIAIWALMQVGHAVIWWTEGQPLRLHKDWTEEGVTLILGLLIAQLFGNALFEEIVFRHVLVSQWFARRRFGRWRVVHLIAAVLGVQLFFALMHVPHRLAHGVAPIEMLDPLIDLTLFGTWHAWIYLQTRNLFLAVGVHALWNTPTLVVAQGMNPSTMIEGTVTVGLLVHLVVLMAKAWRRRRATRTSPDSCSAHSHRESGQV